MALSHLLTRSVSGFFPRVSKPSRQRGKVDGLLTTCSVMPPNKQPIVTRRYLELKHTAPGKAEDMREQELLRSQMALAYRTGDRDKAAQIQERLKPDEVKEREAARRMDPENPMGV